MAGLRSAAGYVRGQLGHRVNLRRTPEVVFIEDRSLERGMRVLSLINQLSQSRTPESENGSAAADNQELEV
jgi:ribosome-binding factor A